MSFVVVVFNIWRRHVPDVLRDVFEKRRISKPSGDASTDYLEFLQHYQKALGSPIRYLLVGILFVIAVSDYIFYPSTGGLLTTIRFVLTSSQKMIDIIFWSTNTFLLIAFFFELMDCAGIMLWVLSVSSWFIRKLSRTFEFRIEPAHPDRCGGLHLLGNFCFGLASPLFAGFVFGSGYLFVILRVSPEAYGMSVYAQIFAGLILFFLLLCSLLVAILTFFVSIQDIHTNMLRKREAGEEAYVAHMAPLQEQIQELLDNNQVDKAKELKEKKDLMEALYVPSPTWPFNVKAKLFSTISGVGGSFLLGFLTALPKVILQAFFHVKL